MKLLCNISFVKRVGGARCLVTFPLSSGWMDEVALNHFLCQMSGRLYVLCNLSLSSGWTVLRCFVTFLCQVGGQPLGAL